MVVLALVSEPFRRDKCSVNYYIAAFLTIFCAISCSPVHEHKAGGGAYDDSALGRVLDSNGPLPEEGFSGSTPTYEEWRKGE